MAMGPCHITHVILIMMTMIVMGITHNFSIIPPLSDHCPIHTLEAKLGWSDGCQWWSRNGFEHLPENVLRIVKRGGQICRIRCVAILLSKVFPSSTRCCLSYYRSILPSPLNNRSLPFKRFSSPPDPFIVFPSRKLGYMPLSQIL
ncbi:uncharacterized protein P174DRAFT_247760 [Aspergillus novofumigatus IBT 16806]|uniref:Uncharacterized protein n=1 Tax=Aspergillus novofumigatus (strain IBT 16806) TaxID=1392255 RepID=A0A2I1C286_ASPN1|nr:uncharacterized protein P174DRAFT_247760 [Aspergillus novofumigatus IBT 16806]PKX91729.1 hypothetical protein P174DRAFT_247760 [Aspergillus novofumigatus IBT 16806]